MKKIAWLVALLFATSGSAQLITPVADRQAMEEFGQSIALALQERDLKATSELIDLRGLATRAARVQNMGKAEEDGFVRTVEKLGMARMLGGIFKTLELSDGKAQFMRVTDTRPMRALVRLDLGDKGFDYLEFVVDGSSGRPRAVDWFQLSTGQLLTVTIGGIGQLFTTKDPTLLGSVLGVKNVEKAQISRLSEIGQLQRAGKYAEAVAAFKQLPEPIANSRLMLGFRSQAASLAGMTKEYDSVLATMAAKYSDDPATAFMLVDHYFNVKDFPKLLAAIDTIEKRIGADGVTNILRATAYYLSGDLANMLKYSDEAIRREPDRLQGYDSRVTALVGMTRYADAIATFRDVESRFGVKFTRDVFADDPLFEKFVASPEFKKWLPPARPGAN